MVSGICPGRGLRGRSERELWGQWAWSNGKDLAGQAGPPRSRDGSERLWGVASGLMQWPALGDSREVEMGLTVWDGHISWERSSWGFRPHPRPPLANCVPHPPQVHCISTEFTPRKHGGEKGVPFRVQIDTFKQSENGEYSEHLHSASCQIKVFKVGWPPASRPPPPQPRTGGQHPRAQQ